MYISYGRRSTGEMTQRDRQTHSTQLEGRDGKEGSIELIRWSSISCRRVPSIHYNDLHLRIFYSHGQKYRYQNNDDTGTTLLEVHTKPTWPINYSRCLVINTNYTHQIPRYVNKHHALPRATTNPEILSQNRASNLWFLLYFQIHRCCLSQKRPPSSSQFRGT